MKSFFRRLPLLIVLLLIGLVLWWMNRKQVPTNPEPERLPGQGTGKVLSVLGNPPDWSRLEVWQETITREDFEQALVSHFVTGTEWKQWIEIREEEVTIQTGPDSAPFLLRFAVEGGESPGSRAWKRPEEMPPAPTGKPLQGLHIAIDPGHIGGKWGKMEERWLVVDGQSPVQEGDMTLMVARLIRPELEKLGARVSLVRKGREPVTSLRPKSLESMAKEAGDPDSPEALQRLAERLFYRTAEIRARADLVNRVLKPDLVLCLHFNADPWGDPADPQLVDRTHFHLLLNGAYTDSEVALADQRFTMLEKLLSRTHDEEVKLGSTCAAVFAKATGMPPYRYPEGSPNVLEVPGQPYLWSRNLLANRLYECPVLFYEPYVMNSTIDHPRMVAGDYEGVRDIGGRKVKSIFREYADAVVEGLRKYYSGRRG